MQSPTSEHVFQLQTLQCENSSLRRQASANLYQVPAGSEFADLTNPPSLKKRPSGRGSRPISMYETGSAQKPYLPLGEVSYPEEGIKRLQPFPPHVSKQSASTTLFACFALPTSICAALFVPLQF